MKAIVDADNSLFKDFEPNAPEIYTTDRDIFRIPKLLAIRIIDIANIFAEYTGGEVKVIGAFESEKLSETMVQGYDSADGPFATPEEIRELLINERLLKRIGT